MIYFRRPLSSSLPAVCEREEPQHGKQNGEEPQTAAAAAEAATAEAATGQQHAGQHQAAAGQQHTQAAEGQPRAATG